MIIDVSIAIIAISIAVLTVFLIMTLVTTRKTLTGAKKDFHHISKEASELMERLEALTSDLKSKSEALNFVFRPLKSLGKEKHHQSDTASEIVDWITTSLTLISKIRAHVNHHEK